MPKSSAKARKRGGDLGTVRFGPIMALAASKSSRSVIRTTTGPRPGVAACASGAAGGVGVLPAGLVAAGERGGSGALSGWL
eukprot:7030155-Alexandrium_andersonii.AAC.1